MKPEIRLIDLTTGYNGEALIRDLNIEIKGYGVVQILGPNGAGKTTLIRTILGLLIPLKGKVIINGEDVTGDPSR
ncbi:MAG: ATP-binding cassette domain-containing protein, partial [Crenarchaeota archaeon]|nr:ATP-binding cassette domain-containing protein [Thermoproteota archaeon]